MNIFMKTTVITVAILAVLAVFLWFILLTNGWGLFLLPLALMGLGVYSALDGEEHD